jgi:hypothetical protein
LDEVSKSILKTTHALSAGQDQSWKSSRLEMSHRARQPAGVRYCIVHCTPVDKYPRYVVAAIFAPPALTRPNMLFLQVCPRLLSPCPEESFINLPHYRLPSCFDHFFAVSRAAGTYLSVFLNEQARAEILSHDGAQVYRRQGRGGRAAASATTDDGTVVYEDTLFLWSLKQARVVGSFI